MDACTEHPRTAKSKPATLGSTPEGLAEYRIFDPTPLGKPLYESKKAYE